jgi:hypothetical protein
MPPARPPESGIVPIRHACVFFDRRDGVLRKILVMDRRLVPREQDAGDITSRYPATHGAFTSSWSTGDDPLDTPAGVFAAVVLKSYPDPSTLRDALRQFAKIEGCDWAVQMWREVTRFDGQDET